MSSGWNLSSEDELDGEEEEDEDGFVFSLGYDDDKQQKRLTMLLHPPSVGDDDDDDGGDDDDDEAADRSEEKFKVSSLASLPVDLEDEDDSGDDDNIDWEDVDEGDDEEDDFAGDGADALDKKPPAKLKAVTIDMNEKQGTRGSNLSSTKNQQSKKRSRKVYRNKTLPEDLRIFLKDLHQTHLLALTARAIQISKCCSDPTLLHTVFSLIPEQHTSGHILLKKQKDNGTDLPTVQQLQDFCQWYCDFVNRVDHRRRTQIQANIAAGAPRQGRRRRHQQHQERKSHPVRTTKKRRYSPPPKIPGNGQTNPFALLQICSYISPSDDPQLNHDIEVCMTSMDKTQLLVSMARAMGWRARYVVVLDAVGQDLDVHHPVLLLGAANIFSMVREKKRIKMDKGHVYDESDVGTAGNGTGTFGWVEILCSIGKKRKWVHIDPANESIDKPRLVEAQYYCRKTHGSTVNPKRLQTIPYALGVEHLIGESMLLRVTDVTPRYSNSWSKSLKERGLGPDAVNGYKKSWWSQTVHQINERGGTTTRNEKRDNKNGKRKDDAIEIEIEEQKDMTMKSDDSDDDIDEKKELEESANKETMPTSKVGFNNHPAYALASQLNINEVLAPDAKRRMCGIFKGEFVYRRSDVSTALVAKKWLYKGRKVMQGQKPIKRVKKRKKPTPKGFNKLHSYGVGESNDGSTESIKRQIDLGSAPDSDGKEDLFAIWQTKPWGPEYIGPNDDIPVNDYKNIEYELINPGLQHLERPRMAKVAKRLGIPYVPCLLGFEGHGGNRTPTIRGIVVHEHNVELLEEAYSEFEQHAIEQEHETQKAKVLRHWKKLITRILIKERVDREYGVDNEN